MEYSWTKCVDEGDIPFSMANVSDTYQPCQNIYLRENLYLNIINSWYVCLCVVLLDGEP